MDTPRFPAPTPSHAQLDASIDVSRTRLEITGADVTLVRIPRSDVAGTSFSVAALPSRVRGNAVYTSPELSYTGTLDVVWSNPELAVTGTTPASRFPLGTARYTGDLKPNVGTPSYVHMTLTSTLQAGKPVDNGAINVQLAINRIAYRNADNGEVLSGKITAVLTTASGNIQAHPVVAADVTHQPTGFKVIVNATNGNITGSMMKGSTKLADIGGADALGLGELAITWHAAVRSRRRQATALQNALL